MRQRGCFPSVAFLLPAVALLLPTVGFLDRDVHLFLDDFLLYYRHWYMLNNVNWNVFHHRHFFHNLYFLNYRNMNGNMDFLHVVMMDRVHFVWDVDGHMFAVNKQELFELCMKRLSENYSTYFKPYKSDKKTLFYYFVGPLTNKTKIGCRVSIERQKPTHNIFKDVYFF